MEVDFAADGFYLHIINKTAKRRTYQINKKAISAVVMALLIAFTFAAYSFTTSAAASATQKNAVVRWEYKVTYASLGIENTSEEFNRLGAEGWEYAGSDSRSSISLPHIFKRRLQ